jgi:ABC-type uncharacterized transport system ATPase subunit
MIQTSGLTRVKFSGEVAQKDLMSLSGIQEVKCDEHGEWLLRSNLSVDINKELMSFALQHNLNIVSLQAQTLQLEDIFRQLTGE